VATLPRLVADAIGRHPAAPVCVAFSGGLDSTVLLHVLTKLDDRRPLRAIHVEHGLHPDSGEWAKQAQATAGDMGVPCAVLQVAVVDSGQGREAAARDARYRALAGALAEGELLATAHHADDQAETVLLALMRGSGPAGLAAMPAEAPFAGGQLLRPLLAATRQELAAWAADHGLAWTDDPSNADTTLARNHLRHQVVPALQAYWPEAVSVLARSARWAAEADELLRGLAWRDIDALTDGRTLDAEGVVALGEVRARNLLRIWIEGLGLRLPPYLRLVEAVRQLEGAADDRVPEISWPGAQLRRWNGRLYASRELPSPPGAWSVAWDGVGSLDLPAGLGSLSLVEVAHGVDPARLEGRSVTVSFRHGGERLRLHSGGPHRQLKHLLAEAGVPPWLRDRIPLLLVDGALVAVGDLFVDADWAASPGLVPTITPPEA
jgi:tRNA(Ile)-lysidine synthase